jgi:hypothetical protein
MTVSSADTAELPRVVREDFVGRPGSETAADGFSDTLVVVPARVAAEALVVAIPAVPVVEKVAPPPDRRALHAARRAQRRDRRKAAALGLGIVGATLAATVAVLGVVR